MRRGDIYFITRGYTEEGSEQRAGRPAIIVSNDKCNEHSDVLEVVYLTTQTKTDLPTHVDIRSAPKSSIALCEQINSIYKDKFGDYIGTCTEFEMAMVDAALAISLGLNFDAPKKEKVVESKPVVQKVETSATDAVLKAELKERETNIVKLTTERDTYKALYESMLDRLVAAR